MDWPRGWLGGLWEAQNPFPQGGWKIVPDNMLTHILRVVLIKFAKVTSEMTPSDRRKADKTYW